jgi:hypothetical protein
LKNNIGKDLAFKVTWKVQVENSSGYVFNVLKSPNAPIVFYPKVSDPHQGIKIILDELQVVGSEPEPEWLGKFTLGNEADLLAQSIKLRAEIEEREQAIVQINMDQDVLKEYKQLLYQTGTPLEEIVEKSFELLGIKITSPSDKKIEDRLFIDGESIIPIEIRGKNSGLVEKDLNQLISRFADKPQTEAYKTRGVFVLNHFREIDPDKRESPFHPNIVKKAAAWDVCLMSTHALYKLVKQKLEGGNTDGLSALIFNTVGFFDMPAAQKAQSKIAPSTVPVDASKASNATKSDTPR